MMKTGIIFTLAASASAFTFQNPTRTSTVLNSHQNEYNRRNMLQKSLASIMTIAAPTVANAVDDDLTRGGVPLTPFNGLAFQYRGNANNGLDASTLNEPSISYTEFLDKLDKDMVEFVEFMFPNGDAAYATLKANEGEEKPKPIRIGEGYPIEDPEGFSSPLFVVKIVKKRGVPYKFTVPAVAAYSK